MADPTHPPASDEARAFGSLLLGAINGGMNAIEDEEHSEWRGSSCDGAAGPVQPIFGQEDDKMELSEQEEESVEAELARPPPLVQQPQFNLLVNLAGLRALGAPWLQQLCPGH